MYPSSSVLLIPIKQLVDLGLGLYPHLLLQLTNISSLDHTQNIHDYGYSKLTLYLLPFYFILSSLAAHPLSVSDPGLIWDRSWPGRGHKQGTQPQDSQCDQMTLLVIGKHRLQQIIKLLLSHVNGKCKVIKQIYMIIALLCHINIIVI